MMTAHGGGGGGTSNADAVRKLSKGGCVKKQTIEEGVKKSENLPLSSEVNWMDSSVIITDSQ